MTQRSAKRGTAHSLGDNLRSGFTIPELLVATSVAALVSIGVLTVFIWCGKQAALCARISWSQSEAMNTADLLAQYIRNASEIVALDENQGTWVQLAFPDGSTDLLVYSNTVPDLRDGRLYLQRTNGTDLIVARGLTEIQSSDGFTTPIFSRLGDKALRVSLRVSDPAASSGSMADDQLYAAAIRFGVCLRNKGE